jgi:protein-tyrosine-phosphatase
MAEGLAKKMLGDRCKVESAGLSPLFQGAAPEATEVMKDLFGVDVSSHQTRSVDSFQLDLFDYIIVLDKVVHQSLRYQYPVLSQDLILWEIEDPFGQEREAYVKTAEKIRDYIQKHLLPLID